MLVIGRLFCDHISELIPRYRIFQIAGLFTSIGLVTVSMAVYVSRNLGIFLTILGFAISGAAVSVVTPVIISVAGRSVTSMPSNNAISLVMSAMYIGLLIGPPIVGFVSDSLGGLNYAFLLIAGNTLLIPLISSYFGTTYDYKR
jgi:MFS family permease